MPTPPLTSRPARLVFTAAAIATFLAVAMGAVVCATDSSAACPNWPGCYVGGILPKGHVNPVIEFVHRVAAVSTAPLILASAVIGLRRGRGSLLRVVPWVSLVGALAAGVFGMMVILFTLPLPLGVLDLVCSLVALIGTVCSAAAAHRGTPGRVGPYASLALAQLAGMLALHALGVIGAARGSLTRCVGWPLLRSVPEDDAAVQLIRWVLAAVLVIGFVALIALAGRCGAMIVRLATAPLALLAVEVVLGMTLSDGGSLTARSLYSVTAVLVLAATAALAAHALTEFADPHAHRRHAGTTEM